MSATTEAPPNPDDEALARLQNLVQGAQQGDDSVLPELRQLLDAYPEIWQRHGDLALQAQAAWLRLISGPDLLLRESLQRTLAQLKAELAEAASSPLEKLLIDRITATWLQLQYADAMYAQVKADSSAQHQALQRRQNSAQQRFLQSLKMLATVRKLLAPSKTIGEPQPRLFTPPATAIG